MKKIFLFSFSLVVASSCGSSASNKETPAVTETPVVEAVQEKTPETKATIQNGMLLGEIEKSDFLSPPFDSWFTPKYEGYEPGAEEMAVIKKNIPEVDQIRIYMGTWCPDSRREVPDFIKLLDAANYDLDKVEMVAVDRSKTAPDNSQELYDVQRVPTFVFYKNGEEIGRFVEYPRESLEKDVAKIVSGEEYKHSYDY